jgi:hypothetical protein
MRFSCRLPEWLILNIFPPSGPRRRDALPLRVLWVEFEDPRHSR